MVYTQHYKIDKFIISTLLLTNHFQICYKLSFDKRKGAWLHWFRCRTRRSKTYATPCRRKGRRPLFLVFYIFTFRYCKNKSLRLSDTVSLMNKNCEIYNGSTKNTFRTALPEKAQNNPHQIAIFNLTHVELKKDFIPVQKKNVLAHNP